MLVFVLFFSLIFFLGIYTYKRTLMAPYVLIPLVWIIVILLYFILPHNYYTIENVFPVSLLLWIFAFVVSSMLTERCVKSREDLYERENKKITRIMICISLCAAIYMSVILIKDAMRSQNIFLHLRMLNTKMDENIQISFGFISYLVPALLIAYLIELSRLSKSNRMIVFILFFANSLVCFVSMAKTSILIFVISSIIVLYRQGKIKRKQILVCLISLFSLFVILQIYRSLGGEKINIVDFVGLYLLGGSVAFDSLESIIPTYDGVHVFRFFYAIANSLGAKCEVSATILDYTTISDDLLGTNVYTVMYPFYMDFGLIGVFVGGLLYGIIGGYLYKKSLHGTPGLVLYSIFFAMMLMQSIGDLLITNASLFIQYVIYANIPFLKNKKW